MTKREQEEYLKRWSTGCYLCSKEMTEAHLLSTVIPIAKPPAHADPEYIHWYCVCSDCYTKGELL